MPIIVILDVSTVDFSRQAPIFVKNFPARTLSGAARRADSGAPRLGSWRGGSLPVPPARDLGSAVSTFSAVWGAAPAEILFGVF